MRALVTVSLGFLCAAALFPASYAQAADTTSPVISSIAVTATASGATITWSTNEPSDSQVTYGTTPGFGSTETSASLITEHSVTLSGLSASTVYHFSVRSTDAAGNTGTAFMFVTSPAQSGGSYTVVRQHDITAYGSSSTQGNQDGSGATYWTRIASTTTANGTVITNKGAGGATNVGVLAQATSATAAQKAADAFIQYGGNAFNSAGAAETHFSSFQSHVATIGHTNFLAWVSHNSTSEPYAGSTWQRSRKLIRYIQNLYPGKAVDMSLIYRYAPPASATDVTDQSNDIAPTSYRHDNSHLNGKGYIYGTDAAFVHWVEARSGGIPFIAPYQRLRSDAQTAQTLGGFVIDLPYVGGGVTGDNDLTGVTASTADPDFAVSVVGNVIRVTRSSATFLTEDRRLLNVTLTKNGYSHTYPVFLSIADLDTAPQEVTLDGNVWMNNDVPFVGVGSGQKLTLAFDWQALSGDSTDRYVLTTASGVGIVIRRVSSNTMRVYVRDAANVTSSVVSLTSSQQFKVADGKRWVFFAIDTTPGVQIAKLAVDDAAAITAVPTANALMNLGGPGSNRVFANSDAGASAPHAKLSTLWVANDYIDIGVQANRDLFRDPVTKAALDLGSSGSVAGITPYLYIRGSAGDFFHGKNFGTGGDLIWADKGRAQ